MGDSDSPFRIACHIQLVDHAGNPAERKFHREDIAFLTAREIGMCTLVTRRSGNVAA